MLTILASAQKRVEAFLAEARRLAECEFPYPHSREALDRISNLFEVKLTRLRSFQRESDQDAVTTECARSLDALFVYLPLLGIILRSTNVRNAFEMWRPILRLARNILDDNDGVERTKLLISSEWDYSPFTFYSIPDLPGFVVIGVPASDSSNPLLVPLAGHELGHSIWRRRNCRATLLPQLRAAVLAEVVSRWNEHSNVYPELRSVPPDDLVQQIFLMPVWARPFEWALKQVEETFCDFIAVSIFGTSYLRAFAYLLAPGPPRGRSPHYPDVRVRASNLVRAATQAGFTVPPRYEEFFRTQNNPNITEADRLALHVADAALSACLGSVNDLARQVLDGRVVVTPTPVEVDRILGRFRLLVPAEQASSIAAIVEAGWLALEDEAIWQRTPWLADSKDMIVKELVLKSMEVFDIEAILEESHASGR